MAQFSYKSITEAGVEEKAVAEATDRYALARQLKQEGKTLISVEEVGGATQKKSFSAQFEKINLLFGKVKLREKIVFARNLAAMLKAGLPMSRALSVMERQTGNKMFERVLSGMRDEVQSGSALSVALGHHPKVFPSLFVSMVHAGEESGQLSDSLSSLAVQLEKSYQLRRRIKGAMMYPSIVVTAMIIVGVVMMIFVVPSLTSTFTELDIDLPKSTQLIIGISDFMQNHTISFLVIVVVAVFGVVLTARHPKGKRAFEYIFLRTPVIKNLIKETNSAHMARTLSSLLISGVGVINALSITQDVVQNSYYKEILAEAEKKIQKGEPIADVFLKYTNLYPVLVGEMISVGEEAGNLPEMLQNVADFYEGEVEEKTKNLSTIIEPILMVLIGTVVGFFAVSMISPIYSISQGI